MDGYQALANAIVKQAATDYMTAIKHLKKHPASRAAMEEAMRIEGFFHSDWYEALTAIDGNYLMNRLRREALK